MQIEKLAGTTVEGEGYLVHIRPRGRRIDVHWFQKLEVGKLNQSIAVTLIDVRTISGIQEPKEWGSEQRLISPPYRPRPFYMEYGFPLLDEEKTTDGSRFLALKTAREWKRNLVTIYLQDSETATLCYDFPKLFWFLPSALTSIGVPSEDVQHIREQHFIRKS